MDSRELVARSRDTDLLADDHGHNLSIENHVMSIRYQCGQVKRRNISLCKEIRHSICTPKLSAPHLRGLANSFGRIRAGRDLGYLEIGRTATP